MRCPYCGAEMIKGFVQSARKVYFTEEKDMLIFSGKDEGDVILTEHNLTCPTTEAYHCAVCKKVIIDYAE